MECFFIGIVAGITIGYFACRWIVKNHAGVAVRLNLATPFAAPAIHYDEPAAVDLSQSPDTVSVDEVKEGKVAPLPDKELDALVRTLADWTPRKFRDEHKFHSDFRRYLLNSGYSDEDIVHEPRVFWSARDEGDAERYAKPDFVIKNRVLVEIKRNITTSGQSDRSLGQMLRYLVAWRSKGPAILLICNQFDCNLRALIARHVRSWKAQDVPIIAYFVRAPTGNELE